MGHDHFLLPEQLMQKLQLIIEFVFYTFDIDKFLCHLSQAEISL